MTLYTIIRQQGEPVAFIAPSTEEIRQMLESSDWPAGRYKVLTPRPEGAPPCVMDGCWGYAIKDAGGKVELEESAEIQFHQDLSTEVVRQVNTPESTASRSARPSPTSKPSLPPG